MHREGLMDGPYGSADMRFDLGDRVKVSTDWLALAHFSLGASASA
jgi:hypothetical protein